MLFGLFGKDEKTTKLNNPIAVEIPYGDETLRLETGRMAKQANGSVLATMGGTMVLATVCAEKSAVEGQDFFPLTVDYQEKFASAGRIPGSRDRREGKASTAETLTARLIDRPIRPLFPETFKNKVQIIAQVFSYDKKNQPDILAMIASSAALALSGVPFQGPIGAARVGFADGKYILNPSKKATEDSEMDLVVAATKDGVLMVESEIGELDETTVLGAVKFGFDAQQDVIRAINELAEAAGKERWAVPEKTPEQLTMESEFESLLEGNDIYSLQMKATSDFMSATDATGFSIVPIPYTDEDYNIKTKQFHLSGGKTVHVTPDNIEIKNSSSSYSYIRCLED
jgi:polyribonucleotide nucleotidyltransferase